MNYFFSDTRWLLVGCMLTTNLVFADVAIHELVSGDLIFVEARAEGVSGAINRSTAKTTDFQFDHVALVEVDNQQVFVLHATMRLGSVRQPIQQFTSNKSKMAQGLQVFRFSELDTEEVDQALVKAKQMLGKPYNYSFILNDDQYYCSDYIERSFRHANIFQHIPMNFKNLATGEIDPIWVEKYQKMQMPVPQDQPGTNPNQLAASGHLTRLGYLVAE